MSELSAVAFGDETFAVPIINVVVGFVGFFAAAQPAIRAFALWLID